MENSNKQLIIDFYAKVFGQIDEKFADAVLADNYIQHNPMVKNGKAGFMEFLALLKQMPKPTKPNPPFLRFIGDENFVAVHSQVEFMGKENATVDFYRIENGLLAEHWDAVQEVVDAKPKVVGSVAIDQQEQAAVSQELVERFVKHVLIEKQLDMSINFLSAHLSLEGFDTDHDSFQLHRVIAEHNFVLTQAEFEKAGTRSVRYDIYRVSDGFIVEHWSVKQVIPEAMAHTNGMI